MSGEGVFNFSPRLLFIFFFLVYNPDYSYSKGWMLRNLTVWLDPPAVMLDWRVGSGWFWGRKKEEVISSGCDHGEGRRSMNAKTTGK